MSGSIAASTNALTDDATTMLSAEALFDLADWDHAGLFEPGQPAWQLLGELAERVAELVAGAGTPRIDGAWLTGDVWLGEGVTVQPGALIEGPALIEDGATIRHGAYLRGGNLIGAGAVVGHATELKQCLLLPGAHAPHFNYAGDSILGRGVNLGAGTILSNLKLDRRTVRVRVGARRVDSGLRKFGAVLGDGCQTGCNTVLNPGTIAAPGCLFYPSVVAVGYFGPRTIVRGPVSVADTDGGDAAA